LVPAYLAAGLRLEDENVAAPPADCQVRPDTRQHHARRLERDRLSQRDAPVPGVGLPEGDLAGAGPLGQPAAVRGDGTAAQLLLAQPGLDRLRLADLPQHGGAGVAQGNRGGAVRGQRQAAGPLPAPRGGGPQRAVVRVPRLPPPAEVAGDQPGPVAGEAHRVAGPQERVPQPAVTRRQRLRYHRPRFRGGDRERALIDLDRVRPRRAFEAYLPL